MTRIDTQRFAELGEVWAHLKPVPGLAALSEISYQLANSYRALHLSGHCYRDISAGNLMFDPKTGDVLICDNDNVGVNRQSRCQVWGTMEYMAPELIRGESDPSTETDLHALAVLLFYVWVWHHPFHGEMEYQYHCWDIPSKKQVYGITPVFVFDPDNPANRLPEDPDYAVARKRWELCPPELKAMFIRAFTEGLTKPGPTGHRGGMAEPLSFPERPAGALPLLPCRELCRHNTPGYLLLALSPQDRLIPVSADLPAGRELLPGHSPPVPPSGPVISHRAPAWMTGLTR